MSNNNSEDKRTPGKWVLHKRAFAHVETESGRSIANCGVFSTNADGGTHIEENKANAAYIVEACNNYEALKQQNEMLADHLNKVLTVAIQYGVHSDHPTFLAAKEAIQSIK